MRGHGRHRSCLLSALDRCAVQDTEGSPLSRVHQGVIELAVRLVHFLNKQQDRGRYFTYRTR